MTLGELAEHVPMEPRVHVPREPAMDVLVEPTTDARGAPGEPAADARGEPGEDALGDAWVEGASGGVVGVVEVVSWVGLPETSCTGAAAECNNSRTVGSATITVDDESCKKSNESEPVRVAVEAKENTNSSKTT